MRVYGASPLYNLVEHLFRFRRLILVCALITTLAAWWIAYQHAETYTARAVVVMGSPPQAGAPVQGDQQPGDARTRLNLLSAVQRDPEFIRTAIRDAIDEEGHPAQARHTWPKTGQPVKYHFPARLKGADLDEFCVKARQAIVVTPKEGVVEIACRWPDPLAADIVNAYFWEFHDAVVNYETAGTRTQEDLLSKLLESYRATEARIEQKLQRYRREHSDDAAVDGSDQPSAYAATMKVVQDLRANILQLQERRDAYVAQLKKTLPRIQSMEVRGRPTDTPEYLAALQKRNEAQQAVDALRAKYQDTHPRVQEALGVLATAEAQLHAAEKVSRATPNIQQSTTIPNPEYTHTAALINQAEADLKGMQATLTLKVKQAEVERRRAVSAGARTFELKSLTDQRAAIQSTRADLEKRLQAAQLARQQDLLRSSMETGVLVRPTAEPESTAGRAVWIYALGPLLGILFGFVLSFFLESFDHTLRTPAEAEKRLGKPVLAVLPRTEVPRRAQGRLGGRTGGELPRLPRN